MKEKKIRFDIRCTKKERAILEELAKDRGITVSELVREKLFGRKVTVRYYDVGKGEKEIVEV